MRVRLLTYPSGEKNHGDAPPPPPNQTGSEDCVAWGICQDGDFSVASAYVVIVGHLNQPRNRLAEAIWSWKGSFRIILLLWRLVSKGLPTNDQIFKRNMADSASCPRCNLPESLLRAMRDCP
ncbi:unnamed protein product [Lupinus luteus]|uniref:Reverse transcriptase zinc-binding domain-containing protein n=1 Tax=Lupinus luteus TaxID=3873 RepID=A0AAV1Y336_LUPLU